MAGHGEPVIGARGRGARSLVGPRSAFRAATLGAACCALLGCGGADGENGAFSAPLEPVSGSPAGSDPDAGTFSHAGDGTWDGAVSDGSAQADAGPMVGSDGDMQLGGRTLVDPGTGDWTRVPPEQVAEVCRLDVSLLDAADAALQGHNLAGVPWAVIRYGKLCYVSRGDAPPDEAWSTTKTLGALVLGAVSYETRDLARTGPKTGPLRDEDRVDAWLDSFSYNRDAHIAHVLAMVAHNTDLSFGKKAMTYDTLGSTQINSLSAVMNAAIAQDSERLGANLEEFTQRFVFGPLGMTSSTWSGGAADKTLGYTWSSTVQDMARVGLLMLHGGVWSGKRVLSEEYVYRMTHPAFEDANTGYGYLTWLNASSNFTFGDIPGAPLGKQQSPLTPGPCAPVAVYREHPHGLSDSPDCNFDAPYSCEQTYDAGAWAAVGLQGQMIAGHPGLDLVITVKNLTPVLLSGTSDLGFGPDTPKIVWDAVVPAIIAEDPVYRGDADAFCKAYGSNQYAPDRGVDER